LKLTASIAECELQLVLTLDTPSGTILAPGALYPSPGHTFCEFRYTRKVILSKKGLEKNENITYEGRF